jgi:hypothetical protein
MKAKVCYSIVLILVAFMLPTFLHAQGGVPDPGGDPDVPIDGGLSILLAAGVGYVAKKGYDSRKRKQETK